MAMEKSTRYLVSVMIICAVLSTETTTFLYLSGFPIIAKEFSIGPDKLQLTIRLYLCAVGISSLIYGLASEFFGRRKMFLLGLFLFITANILCFLSPTIEFFTIARVIAGCGAGVTVVLGRTIILELYKKPETVARIFSVLGCTVLFGISIATCIGGYVAENIGWRYAFLIPIGMGFIEFFLVFKFLEETLKEKERKIFSLNSLLKDCRAVLQNKIFLGYSVIHSTTSAAWWAYIITFPFVFDKLGIEVIHYGYYTLIGTIGFGIGMIVNQFLLRRFSCTSVLLIGVLWFLIASLVFALIYLWIDQSALAFSLGFSGVMTAMAIIFPNATENALHSVPRCRGTASAFIVFNEMLMIYIGTGVLLEIEKEYLMGEVVLFFLGTSALVLGVLLLLIKSAKTFKFKIS